MKHWLLRIAAAGALALALGGCTLTNAYNTLTGVEVSPTAVYVARNAFGAAEVAATEYLTYCHQQAVKPQVCAHANETAVVKAVKSGRIARDSLKSYMAAHPDAVGAKGLYDAVVSATDVINQITSIYRGSK